MDFYERLVFLFLQTITVTEMSVFSTHFHSLKEQLLAFVQTGVPADVPKTIIVGAAGALFGAWLTGRSRTRQRVRDELVALRATQALCYSIANQFFALKRQHSLPMKQRYDEAVRAYANRGQALGQPIRILLDMQTLTPIWFPTEQLIKNIFEKCVVNGEGMATAIALRGSAESLNLAIKYRNELVDEFRKNGPAAEIDKIRMYVAARMPNGVEDTRFETSVNGVYQQTDDGIFFAQRLEGIVVRTSKRLRRRYWSHRFDRELTLEISNWKLAEDLMPSETDYANWTRGFQRKTSLWGRFFSKHK